MNPEAKNDCSLIITDGTLTMEYQGRVAGHRLVVTTIAGDRVVTLDGTMNTLTQKQEELLLILVENRDHPVSRERLLAQLYPDGRRVGEKIIDVFITKIRQSLDLKYNQLIQTIWGRGYSFSTKPLPDTAQKSRAWPTTTKEKVVKEVLAGKLVADASREYDVHPDELALWVEAYRDKGRTGLQSQKLIQRSKRE